MTKGKKNERKNELLGVLFSEYVNSEEAMNEPHRKTSEDFCYEMFKKMEAGTANPEELGELQCNAMKAGFYAGFEMAKALLS